MLFPFNLPKFHAIPTLSPRWPLLSPPPPLILRCDFWRPYYSRLFVIHQGKTIHIEDMEEGWVFFKYGKLPTFCYWCVILGHQDRECQGINKGCLHTNEDEFQFGP